MTKRKANPKVQHVRTRHPTLGHFVPAAKHIPIVPRAGVTSAPSANEQPGKTLDVEKLLR
jgi:hypothetical protein